MWKFDTCIIYGERAQRKIFNTFRIWAATDKLYVYDKNIFINEVNNIMHSLRIKGTVNTHPVPLMRQIIDVFLILNLSKLAILPHDHFQLRISGKSSPCIAIYCLCSISLSRIACLA